MVATSPVCHDPQQTSVDMQQYQTVGGWKSVVEFGMHDDGLDRQQQHPPFQQLVNTFGIGDSSEDDTVVSLDEPSGGHRRSDYLHPLPPPSHPPTHQHHTTAFNTTDPQC